MRHRFTAVFLTVFLTLFVGVPTAAAADGPFADVSPTHWGAETAHKAAALGLMEGTGQGRFHPEDALTRGAFLTILSRMFSWEITTPDPTVFTDCSPDDWFYAAGQQAAALGIIQGPTLRPMAPISRLEMATLLISALELDWLVDFAGELKSPFDDLKNNGYANLSYQIGMTTGVPDGEMLHFNPQGTASRMEGAAMLVRVYERYTAKLSWLHGFYAFSSYTQIDLAAQTDAVSLGWARMCYDPQRGPYLSTTRENGNEWVTPADPSPALDVLDASNVPYNLSVYTAAGYAVTLPDGTTTNLVAAVTSPQYRDAAVAALVAGAQGYAGLTIDFEGMSGEAAKENFSAFMTALRAALPQEQTLYVCVPPDDWYTGFDYKRLGELCDKIILMAHDYQWVSVPADVVGTAAKDIPTAPLNLIYRALSHITHPTTGVADRSKIALALSIDSTGLQVDPASGVVLSSALVSPGPSTLRTRLTQPDTQHFWSDRYQTPSALYRGDDDAWYRVWYENNRSVTAKIELARMFGINGLSIWRLGMVPNYPTENGLDYNLWNTILAQR